VKDGTQNAHQNPQTPGYQWEQALLDSYYDYRWREVLEPLYQKFQQWKAGELDHMDMDEAIHKTHKKTGSLHILHPETQFAGTADRIRRSLVPGMDERQSTARRLSTWVR
jgi:hypothetical protein